MPLASSDHLASCMRSREELRFVLLSSRDGSVHHVRIIKVSNGCNGECHRYSFLNSDYKFTDLCQLVNFYQKNELYSADFSLKLGQPVPHNPITKR